VAIEDQYINSFSDKTVGYAIVTALELASHLMTNYGMINPTELPQKYG
jgi:hypothetical protein